MKGSKQLFQKKRILNTATGGESGGDPIGRIAFRRFCF